MSVKLSAGGCFKPPGRAFEGVCWICRLQLQRRGLHAARPARYPQTISANADNTNGLTSTGKLVSESSTPAEQATAGNLSNNTGPDTSEHPDSSKHRAPDAPIEALPRHRSPIKHSAIRYYKATLKPWSSTALASYGSLEVRGQIQERAVDDLAERKLKAKLDHAIRLSLQDDSPLGQGSVAPIKLRLSDRLNPPAKDSCRSVPKSLIRRYSTNASPDIVSDHAFPISFNKLRVQNDVEVDRPLKDGIGIRKHLEIWQQQQDAIAESNPSPVVNAETNAGLLASYVAGAGDGLLAEPAQIESRSSDLDSPFINDDGVTETSEVQPVILPGDLVEMSVGPHTVLAIYVRTFVQQAQFYTMQGRWIHKYVWQLYFTVPRFVGLAEVAQILPYLPQAEVSSNELDQSHRLGVGVPRNVGASMVEKMKDFVQDSNKVYRAHAERIDNTFNLVADETRIHSVTLSEIASTVLQISDPSTITLPALWAVHRALVQAEIGFRLDKRDHWRTSMFEIISKREVRLVMKVRQWLREFQERNISHATLISPMIPTPSDGVDGASLVAEFVTNSRRIVKESRKYRPLSASGYISPCSVQLNSKLAPYAWREIATRNEVLGYFTENETDIIRFLELWAARAYFRRGSTLSAMGPMLLRAVGMYEGFELDETVGYTFLQELGVFSPWENRVAFNTRLALPRYNFDNLTEELLDDAQSSLVDWKPKDAMEHLRKDWMDLEVFCVDDAGAREIDDGFSLEPIEGDEAHFWVHVHVANPTAFLTPEDPISKYAGRLVESIYLPDRSYSLLSPWLTNKHFSLDKNRPALTFSAKLNADGDILDAEITPSIVRNVKFYTPEYLTQQLSLDGAEFSHPSTFTVGSNPPPISSGRTRKKISETLDDVQRKTLHKLLDLGAARHRQRVSKGAILFRFTEPEASVHYVDNTLPFRRTIRRIEGDPTIKVVGFPFDPTPSHKALEADEAATLVPNLMLLTGEVAALWTSKRGIPMFYRGTRRNPELASASEYKENVLDPLTKKYGAPPREETLRYMNLAGRGYSSPDPVPHKIIGTEAYTKVTSPLRRYGDMLAHWQIEAVLRHEADTGESLVGKRDHSCLPFSRRQVEEIIPHLSIREESVSQAKRASQNHWVFQALRRAHEFKEAVLPETFEVYIRGRDPWSGANRMTGVMKEFGVQCFVRPNKQTASLGAIEAGDWWEAKIDKIDLYFRLLWMTPTRLIKRTELRSSAWEL